MWGFVRADGAGTDGNMLVLDSGDRLDSSRTLSIY